MINKLNFGILFTFTPRMSSITQTFQRRPGPMIHLQLTSGCGVGLLLPSLSSRKRPLAFLSGFPDRNVDCRRGSKGAPPSPKMTAPGTRNSYSLFHFSLSFAAGAAGAAPLFPSHSSAPANYLLLEREKRRKLPLEKVTFSPLDYPLFYARKRKKLRSLIHKEVENSLARCLLREDGISDCGSRILWEGGNLL